MRGTLSYKLFKLNIFFTNNIIKGLFNFHFHGENHTAFFLTNKTKSLFF